MGISIFKKTAVTVSIAVIGMFSAATAQHSWYTNSPEANEFTISTARQLESLAEIVNGTASGVAQHNFSGQTIKLANDIDLSDYDNWTPIGGIREVGGESYNPQFHGTFDGNGKIIRNLTINSQNEGRIGLFGYLYGGEVKNLGLVDVNITAGGIAGYTGGIVGQLYSPNTDISAKINNCYTTGTIVVNSGYAGGIAGIVHTFASINNCYSTADVSGTTFVGGIAGHALPEVSMTNCYSIGKVTGTGNNVGGIVGRLDEKCTLKNCAALNSEVKSPTIYYPGGSTANAGRVTGGFGGDGNVIEKIFAFAGIKNHAGDFVWTNKGAESRDGVDIYPDEILSDGTLGGLFTANDVWTTENGKLPGLFGRPVDMPEHLKRFPDRSWYLKNTEATTFTISTANGLAGLAEIVNDTTEAWSDFAGKTINLAANIDLSGYGAEWNGGKGWIPIGKGGFASARQRYIHFSGVFDGTGKTVSGLYIKHSAEDAGPAGLFGIINGGKVMNLGVVNMDITGTGYVGGVVGGISNDGAISNCYSTGTVSAAQNELYDAISVGGIAGRMYGSSMTDCHSSAVVSATKGNSIGGLVGTVNSDMSGLGVVTKSYFTGTVSSDDVQSTGGVAGIINGDVTNCYSTGNVTGKGAVGGIVGSIEMAGSVAYCYSTGTVSGGNFNGGIAGTVSNIIQGPAGIQIKIENCAALNPSVGVMGRPGGRVIGGFHAGNISPEANNDMLESNIAFAEMAFNGNPNGGTLTNSIGLSVTADEIGSDGTLGGRFAADAGWTVAAGKLPGLNGQAVDMPEHLGGEPVSVAEIERVVPGGTGETAVVAPVRTLSAAFTAGPNVVGKSGAVNFYRVGKSIQSGMLTIYDASGNVVGRVGVADHPGASRHPSGGGELVHQRRVVGSWDLTDRRGRPVGEGTYLVRGVVVTSDGKRERVSVVIGVR